jgi:hypothetical protein
MSFHPTNSPHQDALTYLRNTFAASPKFGDAWEVMNIENVTATTMVLDLDNGKTIRLDIQVYDTDPNDFLEHRAWGNPV